MILQVNALMKVIYAEKDVTLARISWRTIRKFPLFQVVTKVEHLVVGQIEFRTAVMPSHFKAQLLVMCISFIQRLGINLPC